MDRWSPPSEFDEYRLLRPLGAGQMGQVHLAYDTLLARHVAIKFIAELKPDESSRQRFLVEARAAARLQHPNVVAIYRVGELDRHPYLVSEFIRGQSLDRVPRPLAWKRALEIGVALARGLAAAHRSGVLHRDIKPANAILAEDGTVKLVDFGLAKLLESRLAETAARELALASLPSVVSLHRAGDARDGTSHGPSAGRPVSASMIHVAGMSRGDAPVLRFDSRAATSYNASPPPLPTPSSVSVLRPRSTRATGSLAIAASIDPMAGEERATAQLTCVGGVLGTPDYMPPEVWRGEPATRRSDVYSLGALLYELCEGRPPFADLPLEELGEGVQRMTAPSLAATVRGVDSRFAQIVDRCLERLPEDRFESGDDLRQALESLAGLDAGGAIPEGNPYRGLRPFEAQHRGLFFGRDSEISVILDRLRADPFVLVTGDSGIGKSSICRAGVLPHIETGALEGGRRWTPLVLVPGRHPARALTTALAGRFGLAESPLADKLRKDPAAVVLELRKHLGDQNGIVFFVDQLEELLTLADPDEAETVDDLLGRLAARVPGVRILATARADFLTRLAGLRYLGEEIARALYILGPLGPERARDAVVGPAERTGITFETDELVEILVHTAGAEHGGLPLLQFALSELWEARDRSRALITQEALEAIGGVGGALARHADAVMESLLPEQRVIARRVITRLVTLDGTRARRTEAELVGVDPFVRTVLERFVHGRLVVTHESEQGPTCELAHEVLIESWGTLRHWLDEDGDWRRTRERIAASAAEWERLGRDRGTLWSARQLAELEGVDTAQLHAVEHDFVTASRVALRHLRWLKVFAAACVPIAIGAIYGVLTLHARRELDRRIEVHLGAANVAVARARLLSGESAALRQSAFHLFDDNLRDSAEMAWSRVLSLGAEAERRFQDASGALEAAVALDPARLPVRALFADTLYERALLAEQDHRYGVRDELLQRMQVHDPSGDRLQRWRAHAHLTLSATPEGAEAVIERYTADAEGRLHLEPAVATTATPIDVRLPPGSYRITVGAPGRAALVLPALLNRGEPVVLSLRLPEASEIPDGFVYVPAGHFTYGSTADEGSRRGFFDAVPAHDRSTEAFLIARSEVTFADWIQFLEDLPPADRRRFAPSVPVSVGSSEGLALVRRDGAWWYTRQVGSRQQSARAGDPVRYEARDRRAIQDWRKFPVTGISAVDAEAYVAWLRRTGRLSRARLCTELEWERAARGADAREYPHGDRLDPDDANFDETYRKEPAAMGLDEIGSHPASRSPFGLDDMAGNAFEWTAASRDPGHYVGRGGAWFYDPKTARVTNRAVTVATLRDVRLGMRLCASVPR